MSKANGRALKKTSPEAKLARGNGNLGALQVEYRPIASLVSAARNARTHSEEQVFQIVNSMKEFGWTNPVLIDAQGGIIAGHGRILAAQKLGIERVPCIELAHLTEAQKRAYAIADNKLALNAGWSDDLLKLELIDLKELNFDLDLTGFQLSELDFLFSRDEPLLDLGVPPETVEQNAAELESFRALRKKGDDAVQTKTDTERFIIVVYPSREEKSRALLALGLREDERYIPAASFSIQRKGIVTQSAPKSAPLGKAGATG